MADVFDNEADPTIRDRLWRLIRRTQRLDWLLLTKRIGNVPKPLTSSGTKRGFFPAGLHLRRRARPLHLPGGGKTHAYPQLGSLNFGAFGASDARVWPAHVPVFGSVGNIPHEAEIGAFRGQLISNLCWYPSGPRYRRIVPRDR